MSAGGLRLPSGNPVSGLLGPAPGSETGLELGPFLGAMFPMSCLRCPGAFVGALEVGAPELFLGALELGVAELFLGPLFLGALFLGTLGGLTTTVSVGTITPARAGPFRGTPVPFLGALVTGEAGWYTHFKSARSVTSSTV